MLNETGYNVASLPVRAPEEPFREVTLQKTSRNQGEGSLAIASFDSPWQPQPVFSQSTNFPELSGEPEISGWEPEDATNLLPCDESVHIAANALDSTLSNHRGDTPARLKRLKAEFPVAKKITKTELAKYLMTWAGMPHSASQGLQKNFERFSGLLDEDEGKSRWSASSPGSFRRIIAQAIIFHAVQRLVRPMIPAFQANVIALHRGTDRQSLRGTYRPRMRLG